MSNYIQPLEICENIAESHGICCVFCNACGRKSKLTQREDGLKLFNRLLEEEYKFPNKEKDITPHQYKIWNQNIEYFKEKISKFEGM